MQHQQERKVKVSSKKYLYMTYNPDIYLENISRMSESKTLWK